MFALRLPHVLELTVITAEDRVRYAEAQQITGRSRSYLAQQARAGVLRRDGGTPQKAFDTWLSRAECEDLGLARYRRGMAGGYWLTRSQAADLLGLSRGYLYQLPFRHYQTAVGDQLLRRLDVEAFAERRRLKKANARVRRRPVDQRPQ